MTFVVTEQCIRCKYTDCVEVCPVDCFYEGPNFLAINPDECIDCALCEPECPVDAIYSEDDLPEKYQPFLQLNAELAAQKRSFCLHQEGRIAILHSWITPSRKVSGNRWTNLIEFIYKPL